MSSSAMAQFACGGIPSQLPLDSCAIEPRQAIELIAGMAIRDADAALQMVRDVLAADRGNDRFFDSGQIANAIAAQLDDGMREALTESPAGRQLLELLNERGGDAVQTDGSQPALNGSAVLAAAAGFALHASVRPTRRRGLRPRRA